jgi:hypothetical protein
MLHDYTDISCDCQEYNFAMLLRKTKAGLWYQRPAFFEFDLEKLLVRLNLRDELNLRIHIERSGLDWR